MLAMRANQAVMLWCLLAGSAVGTQVSTTQSSSRYASQVDAAAALIGRLVGPDRAAAFDLQIVEAGVHDSFALPAGLTSDGKIAIAGTSGVALASGFNWYLKYTVGREISYPLAGLPMLSAADLPDVWPSVTSPVNQTSAFKYRYYMNVVTHSYSAAFWDEDRWMQEIDWMALSGVNLPLAFTGQEWAFYRVYTEHLNLTKSDLDGHFAGPAFLAWGRMGNIRGWGGSYDAAGISGLTLGWMQGQRDLQKKIVERERSLGMRTVLGAFAGHVPDALKARYPSANVTNSPGWCGFNARYSSVPLLEASDPLFAKIATAFVQVQGEEYGFDDASDVQFFNGDNFNEMSPRSRNSDYLATWGEAMFQPLAAESSGVNGSWFVQGWSLGGWPDADVSAYWSKVPAGRLLSLDLNCAMNGGTFKKFTDRLSPPRDVVCGLLENMGGRRALDGGLATLSRQSLQNANYSAYVSGLGWNPEDLHCNPIKWALLADVAWRSLDITSDSIETWVQAFGARRYVTDSTANGTSATNPHVLTAWANLLDAAYGGTGDSWVQTPKHLQLLDQAVSSSKHPLSSPDSDSFSKDGLCRLPSLSLRLYHSPDPVGIMSAWSELILAADFDPAISQGEAFKYDLADVARQGLQNIFAEIFASIQQKCQGWDSNIATVRPQSDDNYTEHDHATCGGTCLAADASGNCDRMPGCGHDRVPPMPPCDVEAMKARCSAARPYMGKNCTAFNTNGYLYNGRSVQPFSSYPLSCYVLDAPKLDLRECTIALDMNNASSEAAKIVALAKDMDRILLTTPRFLLSSWIASARAHGNSSEEQDWLEWNARAQVSSWGSVYANGNTITDYAAKQWGGLIGTYHIPLWQLFFLRMHTAAANGTALAPSAQVEAELYALGETWTNSTTAIPGLSGEDTLEVARQVYAKWTV